MSEQQSPNNHSGNNSGNNNNNRRHNNRRRRPQGQGQGQNQNRPASAQSQQGGNQNRPQAQNQNQNRGPNQNRPQQGQNGGNQNRRPHHHNRNRPRPENRPQGGQAPQGGFNFDRVYEKYLNLLDQHIIARRKYHDLFYRADPNQKIKLEKNFYNTLNDIREFENRLAPDVKEKFEKRNNGLKFDHTYTTNHEISIDGDPVPEDLPAAEPHYLQSQRNLDYSNDTEESVGTAEDYLKYKGI